MTYGPAMFIIWKDIFLSHEENNTIFLTDELKQNLEVSAYLKKNVIGESATVEQCKNKPKDV
jgi:hypothetical protein